MALQGRNQFKNENVGMYTEDMSRLFRRADPNMSEDKKLRHLMRGVKQELFAVLVRNTPRTVTEFRSQATAMEKMLEQRARQYNRDVSCASAQVFSGGSRNDYRVLRELIREELSKLHVTQAPPALSVVDIVRDELRQVIRDAEPELQPIRRMLSYADVIRQPAVQSNVPVATTVNFPPKARSAPRVFEPKIS